MAIMAASGGLSGDDPDKKKRAILLGSMSQFIETWPIIGNDIFSVISGKNFQAQGVKLFPMVNMATEAIREATTADWDNALTDLIQAASFGVGLPYSGPKRAVEAIATGRLEKLLNWPVKETK
jgi:hypothetical protein